jgi:hypothetical protein
MLSGVIALPAGHARLRQAGLCNVCQVDADDLAADATILTRFGHFVAYWMSAASAGIPHSRYNTV